MIGFMIKAHPDRVRLKILHNSWLGLFPSIADPVA